MAFEMDPTDAHMAKAIEDSIQNAASNTARSAQAADHQMGISNLGHCQQYAVLMTRQTPFSDVVDKTPAFYGTVAGEAIERQVRIDHPDWIVQPPEKLVFTLESGHQVPGTPDIVVPASAATPEFPQGVYDLKSKAELETIRKVGRTRQQHFQTAALVHAAIDKGWLDPTTPIRVADLYFDRSGTNHSVFALGEWYDEQWIFDINEWVGGVIYAVVNNEDGAREMPRTFCETYCEYFTACRGQDTDVSGLIDDPEKVAAIDTYKELADEMGVLKKRQEAVKPLLDGLTGSTGKWQIRPIVVTGGQVSYYRADYTKPSITKVPPPKVKAPKKAKKP